MTFECYRAYAADRPNATEMYRHLITDACPSGIFITATINWKKNRTVPFFGGSYTAPTPVAHTMQQLGLVVTRGFGLLFRQGAKRMGVKPQKYTDGVEPIIDPPTPVRQSTLNTNGIP